MKRASALVLLCAMGCERDLGVTLPPLVDNPRAEELQQGIAHEVILHRNVLQRDILWVVADCRSMLTPHLRLWQQAEEILSPFLDSPDDWHMGVLRAWAKFHAYTPPERQGALIRSGDVRYITPETPAPVDRFKDMIKGSEGLSGNGWEGEAWAYQSMKKAFTEPRLNDENEGFFRRDAELDIIMVSDVDEDSYDTTAQEIALLLAEFKPHPSMVRAHSVVVPETGGCGEIGRNFHRLTDEIGGTEESICDNGWNEVIEDIAKDLKYATQWYYLRDMPVPRSIRVQVTTDEFVFDGLLVDDEGKPVEECDTVCATYRYDATTNAITFDQFNPPLGSRVDIWYKRLRDFGGSDTGQ
jgi:hypothetical protein